MSGWLLTTYSHAHRTQKDAGQSQQWPGGCEGHVCAVLCTASCVTCAWWSTELLLSKTCTNNLNAKDELHSMAAANRLYAFTSFACIVPL